MRVRVGGGGGCLKQIDRWEIKMYVRKEEMRCKKDEIEEKR